MSMTSVIRYVQALDTTSTTGAGKTGLAFGDVTAKYLVQGGTLTSLTTETITTLGTYQAPTSAAHIRIKELASADPTAGIYEVHLHNTQVAGSGKKLWLFLSASGARFAPIEVDLVPFMDGEAQSAADLKDFADAGYDPADHEVFSLSATGEASAAAAVRTNLTTELGRIDAAISTRATPAQVNTEADTAISDAALVAKLDAIQADLPQRITKNVAVAVFPFKMVDETDHKTGETGLTVTATRSLDGAAFASCANAVTEIAGGWYTIALATTDTNANVIIYKFTGSGADDREIVVFTQPT